MADSKTTTTFTVAVTEEELERIDREANRDRRSRSGLIKSIVLPEIERREQEREETVPA